MASEERPPIAIGHVVLRVSGVPRAAAFYATLGLRPIWEGPALAILELSGGTHLMLFQAERAPRPGPVRSFDFMVSDIEALRERLTAAGVETTEPTADERSGHRWFQARDPDGHLVSVYSDHTEGRVV